MNELEEAVAVLSWDGDHQGLSADARDRMTLGTARSLGSSLAAARTPAAATAAVVLGGLPDHGLRPLLRSPRIRELLWAAPDLTEVCHLIGREAARCGHDANPPPGWSALGDTWIGGGRPDRSGSPGPGAAGVGPIAVDVSLPPVVERPSGGLREPVAPSGPGLTRVRDRADAGLRAAARVSPTAHSFVCDHTSTVVFRSERADPAPLRSASSAAAPGRTMLINVDDASGDGAVAEALLHEAIHTFLTTLELRQPLVAAGASVPMRSPWTGHKIPGRALLHACFVWFGLYRYRQLAGTGPRAGDDATAAVGDPAAGFRDLDTAAMERDGVVPSEPCRRALELMKAVVLDGGPVEQERSTR
ncbi:MAG: aKG-HExxH-type peptide beta-hydroxylase [Acidimicrobiales bacterium]